METDKADPDRETNHRRDCTYGDWHRNIYDVSATDDDNETLGSLDRRSPGSSLLRMTGYITTVVSQQTRPLRTQVSESRTECQQVLLELYSQRRPDKFCWG